MAASLVDIIEDHYVRTWMLMGGAVGGEVIETPDRVVCLAALDHIPYNHVLRCVPDGSPDETVDEIFGLLGEREAVWTISSRCGPADLEARLIARGCEPYAVATGMSLDLTSGSAPGDRPGDGVTFAEVTPATLETWADLVIGQWHLSAEDRDTLLAMHAELGYETVRRFLCLVDGEPAGKASMAVYEPGVIGIYGVGTTPERRGQGLASALTAHVVRAGADAGANLAVLHSTPMAVGIYRRLGFVPQCELPVFSKPAHAPERPQPPVDRLSRI